MASGLVDQYGRELKREDLLQEQAAPSMIGVRSILSRHVTTGMEPERLAAIMKEADYLNADSYLCMAEELEEKDLHYRSVLSTRKLAVAQLDITVEPASDDANDVANATIIEQWLKRDMMETELFDIQDAIGKGYSSTEIIWDISENQWLPKCLEHRDPRWFRFDRMDGRTLQVRDNAGFLPLLPYKFIVHKPKIKSGLPIRSGVARPCAWMWLFKNFSIKDWIIFNEVYGQPIRVGKYGPRASEEDRNILLRAVSNIGSDAAAIIPESMQIELVEAVNGAASAEAFKMFCDFADQQMSKCIIGQTATTDAIAGGHAVGKEHNDVRGDIERADAKALAATLNRDLVIPIITLNRGPQKAYPRIFIGRAEDVDIKAVSDVAAQMVNTGMKVSAKKLRDRILPGLEPDGDDDVLIPPSGVAPMIADNGQPQESATARHRCGHAASAQRGGRDAIDDLTDQMAADWEPVMTPIADQIRKVVAASADFADLQQRLLGLADGLDIGPAGEALAKALFNANLAGQFDAKIGGEE